MVARITAPLNQTLVSILIPVYNRPVLVERAINSALAQTHGCCEIVVIDNASTDSTWETVSRSAAQHSRIRAYRNATNLGPLRSWMKGLYECRGDYVKILWSDDWIGPTFVADCLRTLQQHPEAGIAFTATLVHDEVKDRVMYHFPEQTCFTAEEYIGAALRTGCMPVSPGCTLVARQWARFRNDYSTAPGLERIAFDTGAGADMLFIWEAAADSGGIAHVPKFLSHFDCSPTSFTMTQSSIVSHGYRLASDMYLNHILRDAAMRERLTATPEPDVVPIEPRLKRWERVFRHSWRRAAYSLATRLGWRAA